MVMRTKNGSGTARHSVGLIIRQRDPNNLEMPFEQLGEFITPSELFYIRSHFPRQRWIRSPIGCPCAVPCGTS